MYLLFRKARHDAVKSLPLLRDPNMYREYLQKALSSDTGDSAHLSVPLEHDYTSTLHPLPMRSLADSLPPPPPPVTRFDASQHAHSEQQFTHSSAQRADLSLAQHTGAHGSTDSLTSSTAAAQTRRFKEHIYETPKFPDTNRAQSADAAIAYSHMTSDAHNNNKTT